VLFNQLQLHKYHLIDSNCNFHKVNSDLDLVNKLSYCIQLDYYNKLKNLELYFHQLMNWDQQLVNKKQYWQDLHNFLLKESMKL